MIGVAEFIRSIDNELYNKIRNSQSDAECRRYLKEHLQKKLFSMKLESILPSECGIVKNINGCDKGSGCRYPNCAV
jgi:hypothetical protein